jgi:hypothetical protein
MVMIHKEYPYSIPYPRTFDWWDGKWHDLAKWCDESIGEDQWEYYYQEFVFKDKGSLMLFKLRWS